MKQYDSYKDSGIEWIGEIPSHWEICRFKDLTTLQTLASTSDNKIGLENIEGKTGRLIETDSEFEGNGIAFEQGDIVYGKLRPYLQKVWVATFSGNAVGDFFVFRTKSNCYNRYLFYVMLSDGFTSMCNGATFGAKMPRVSSDFIRSLHYYIPPYSEQQTIAIYLDKKCEKIDEAIATQQKRIDLLGELRQNIITHAVTRGINPDAPLKDSGVEWIGKVPEHWKVMKMNYALRSISDVNHYMPDNVPDGYPYIMTGDLKKYVSETDFEKCKQISKEDYKELSVKSKAEKGDVIFARYATIGTVCYVDIDKDFIVSYSCVTIKPKKKVLSGLYLYYLLQSHTFSEDISQGVNSNTQGNVGIDSLSSSRVIVPPLIEQHNIVSYIESKTASLDNAIEKANRQIELLQELKQSIITEVVTGKRKVVA